MSGGHSSRLGAYLGTSYAAPTRCRICGLDIMDGQRQAEVAHPEVSKWSVLVHAACVRPNVRPRPKGDQQ